METDAFQVRGYSKGAFVSSQLELARVKHQGICAIAVEIPIEHKQYVHGDAKELVFIAAPESVKFSNRGGIVSATS
jgi:alpha/beta superfamily hydrolase